MEWVRDDEMWLDWIRLTCFADEADYNVFCWVTQNIEATA